MSLPLAILLGAGSTAITAYAAYKKGEISEAEYRRATAAADELERKLKTLRPDETWENINPQLLTEVAKYSPDIAAFVEENAPQLVQEADSATEKRIQRQALQSYAAQAETGRDVISEAQQEQALFESDARAKARRNQLMESLRRQGALGSGAGLVAQLQGEQAEQQSAREQSLRAVQEAEQRRRQSLSQAASLSGQIRGQNINVESANVGTMNAYNQRLANARNLYNQYASGARNQAQMENQRREISRQSSNLQLANEYAKMNRLQSLAAKDRARQFDVDLVNKMSDVRGGAESARSKARAQQFGDYATALSTGIGTGLSAYSGLTAGAADAAKQSYWDAAGKGLTQGLSSAAAQRMAAPEPRYNLGVDYSSQPSNLVEEESSESFGSPQSSTARQYGLNIGDLDEDGNPILPGAAKRRKIREGR
jgi:hypothetical protein